MRGEEEGGGGLELKILEDFLTQLASKTHLWHGMVRQYSPSHLQDNKHPTVNSYQDDSKYFVLK